MHIIYIYIHTFLGNTYSSGLHGRRLDSGSLAVNTPIQNNSSVYIHTNASFVQADLAAQKFLISNHIDANIYECIQGKDAVWVLLCNTCRNRKCMFSLSLSHTHTEDTFECKSDVFALNTRRRRKGKKNMLIRFLKCRREFSSIFRAGAMAMCCLCEVSLYVCFMSNCKFTRLKKCLQDICRFFRRGQG
jgi:hypothetical protein